MKVQKIIAIAHHHYSSPRQRSSRKVVVANINTSLSPSSFSYLPSWSHSPFMSTSSRYISFIPSSSQPPSSSSRRHRRMTTSAGPRGTMHRLPAFIHVLWVRTRSARLKSPASKTTSVTSSRDAGRRSSRGKSLYYHPPRRPSWV
jgi:hypothetical protein